VELSFVVGKPIPISLDFYNPRGGATNLGGRWKTTTSCSDTSSSLTSGEPMKPLPPITRIRIWN
jgi:hypothetical protein